MSSLKAPLSRLSAFVAFLVMPATALANDTAEYRAAYECAMESFKEGYSAGPTAFCIGNSRDPSAIEEKAYADAERNFSERSNSEPNVQIRVTNPVNQLFHIRFVRVELRAMDDEVMVENVVVNRGNCKIENTDILSGKPILPKALKFGETVAVTFSGPCEAAQVDVTTSKGGWSWTMNY